MNKRTIDKLPEELWSIIDDFKINRETESDVISNIVKDFFSS